MALQLLGFGGRTPAASLRRIRRIRRILRFRAVLRPLLPLWNGLLEQ